MTRPTESANSGANGASSYYATGPMHFNYNHGSGMQNNNNDSGTQHNYNKEGQNINHGSGDINVNNQYGPLKPTSVLDKAKSVLMDKKAALEDLKEVEQRLKANDFLEWKDGEAQKLLDQFHRASEVATGPMREKILEKMNEFSKKSNMLPSCLWIQDGVEKLDSRPLDETGAYATVWRGQIGNDPQIVALKIIKRHVEGELEKVLGELIRETLIWRQLNHENILPFRGAYLFNEEPKEFCLVSPWMENGNLPNFIKNNPNIGPELQYDLALDIASGLAYLHDKGITHGDIKGNNILIDGEGNARITDFGLSRIANATSAATTSTSRRNGTGPVRWQAPELIMGDAIPAPSSDVYAYGCIYAKMVPFHGFPDAKVTLCVLTQKKRPERIEGAFPDPMWDLMWACWKEDPAERLSASKVVDHLEKIEAACIRIPKGGKKRELQPSYDLLNHMDVFGRWKWAE
ncbi:Rho guanine nucleotide exchange factor [Marasmius crinis-equi]|uniref:Rho guanine nucleotide exchange factor n=1 Tax=Marasmius crinis-equi TaxID=585013 RepID=A0ABR3F8G8_9AGAR